MWARFISIYMFITFFLSNCGYSIVKDSCSYSIKMNDINSFKKSFNYQNNSLNASTVINTVPIQDYLQKITNTKSFSAYNATHNLLVPLVYSYDKNDTALKNAFSNFFLNCNLDSILTKGGQLDQLHFCYITSEYTRYAESTTASSGTISKVDLLFNKLKAYILKTWQKDQGNVWGAESCFFVGKRSRVAYILNYPNASDGKKYYHAITDFELFTMSAGASLACYELQRYGKVSDELAEIVYYYLKVLQSQTKFYANDQWLLQPGVWSDYNDYLYAGNTSINNSLIVKEVTSIGWDASHFSRMPGFLNTLSALFGPATENGKFIGKLKRGLANQFIDKVVSAPQHANEPFRFKNFMDGTNGVFRYKYTPTNAGYGPYGNSSHILYGWWGLLNDKRINTIYSNIYTNYSTYYNTTSFKLIDQNIPSSYNYFKTIAYLSSQ